MILYQADAAGSLGCGMAILIDPSFSPFKTDHFDANNYADIILVVGSNTTEAHPTF